MALTTANRGGSSPHLSSWQWQLTRIPWALQGSTFVYDRILAPVFAEHEKEIDKALAGARGGAVGLLGKAINWAWAKVREGMNVSSSRMRAIWPWIGMPRRQWLTGPVNISRPADCDSSPPSLHPPMDHQEDPA